MAAASTSAIEATIVSAGVIVAVTRATLVGPAIANVEKMMANLFLPAEKFVMDQNALVINTGDKLALFETAWLRLSVPTWASLSGNLNAAGITPSI